MKLSRALICFSFFIIFLVSCSGGKSGKSDLKFDVKIEGLNPDQKAIFLGIEKSSNRRIVKSIELGAELSFKIPNGSWTFNFISWTGSSAFLDKAKCYSTSKDLNGGEVIISGTLTTAQCPQDQAYDSENGYKPLKLTSCSSIDHVTASDQTCTGPLRGFAQSYKVSIFELDEVNKTNGALILESGCISSATESTTVSTSFRLPYLGKQFPVSFKSFESSNCVGTPKIDNSDVLSDQGRLTSIVDASEQSVFIATSGALKVTKIYSASGSSCDYNTVIKGAGLGINSSGGPFLLRGPTNGSGTAPALITSSLTSGASPALADTVNPEGDESIKGLVKVGNSIYFSATSQTNYHTDLFRYSSSGIQNVSPTATAGTSAYSGVMTSLIASGTKIFFGFKEDEAGDQKLCHYDTLTASASCSSQAAGLTDVKPIIGTSTGVIYTGYVYAATDLSILSYNASTDVHNVGYTASGEITSYYQSFVEVAGGLTYLRLSGSPQNIVVNVSGLTVNIPAGINPISAPLSLGSEAVYTEYGMIYFINGSTATSIESRSSITINEGGGGANVELVGVVGDYLYFNSNRGYTYTNLFAYNKNTYTVTQISSNTTPGTSLYGAVMGNSVYYHFNGSSPGIIYKATGTTESVVKQLNTVTSYIYSMKVIGSKFYFYVDHETYGSEPWVSDGTAAGTQLLKDTNPGNGAAYPYFVDSTINGYVVFASNGKLWRTKGTPSTTEILYGEPSNEYFPSSAFILNGKLILYGQDWANSKVYTLAIGAGE